MGWNATDPVTDPTAGQMLDEIGFSHGGHIAVTVALTSPGPWTVILRHREVNNAIRHSILLSTPGGTVVLGPLPEIKVGPGEVLQILSRDAGVGEHQATLFTRQGR